MKHSFYCPIYARLIVLFAAVWFVVPCLSQELEPRRWSHLPMGVNFAGGGYVYTNADIAFDPVLLIEDVKMEMHTLPFKYIRSFELLGKSARIDFFQAVQDARWTGMVDGVPAETSRSGFSDMSLRLAVNLYGAPPLSKKEFAEYRAATKCETIIGLGCVMQIPTGHYLEDRLLNLGSNRMTFRPQLGIVRREGKWATEATVSSWIYTDNNQFYGGNIRSQMPFYTVQGHVDYTFRPGLWVGSGVAWGAGGESRVNGIRKSDTRKNLGWVVSMGYPLSPKWGAKVAYIGNHRQTQLGVVSSNIAVALSAMW